MTATRASGAADEPPRYGLRAATEADVDFLLALRLATMSEYHRRSGVVLSRNDELARVMSNFASIQIVVGSDGADIGMLKVVRTPDAWRIVQFQLTPHLQGRGLGGRLLRQLLDDAAAADVPIALSVLKLNPSRRLYERHGFVVVREKVRSFEMRCDRADATRTGRTETG